MNSINFQKNDSKKENKNIRLKILNQNKKQKLINNNNHKPLFNKRLLRKSQSMKDFSKNISSKNKLQFYGPYNHLFGKDGGFCKTIENNNLKKLDYLNKKNNIFVNHRYQKNNKKLKLNKSCILNNNSSKNIVNEKNNKKLNKGIKRKEFKVNINDVLNNIKFLNLTKENITNEKEEINLPKIYTINFFNSNLGKSNENKNNYFFESSAKTSLNQELNNNEYKMVPSKKSRE